MHSGKRKEDTEEALDEALDESFPASDPPAIEGDDNSQSPQEPRKNKTGRGAD